MRVLVVEDEPLISSLYARALGKDKNITVETAKDKIDAVAKIEHFEPDIVFLDLMIPLGTHEFTADYDHPAGFDVLETVKRNPHTKNAKVIVLSCLDGQQHKAHAESLGADAYVVKSEIDPHELIERSRQMFAKQAR
jgi:chemosensory pili system protein ChpA (sensor histidine kinase/response regulator)